MISAEDAVAARQVADRGALLVGQAVGDELAAAAGPGPAPSTPSAPYWASASWQATRTMRSRTLSRVEVGGDADDGVEQAAQPVLGVHDVADARSSSASSSSRRARDSGDNKADGSGSHLLHAGHPISRRVRLGQIQDVHHIRCAHSARGMTSAESTGSSHQKLTIASTT